MTTLDRGRLALCAQQSAFEAANGRGLLVRKLDSVSFFWQSRCERPVERGMTAKRRGQGFIAGVGNLEAHVEMDVVHRVGHGEPKRERKMRPACHVVGEVKRAGRFPALAPAERLVAGKSVLSHGEGLPPVAQLVVLEPADDGKQDRGMARPGRSRLPQQLESLGVFHGTQFSAVGLYSRRNLAAVERVGHVFVRSKLIARTHARSTKLSTTFFSPAFSKAIVSLLPSIFTTWP